MLAAILILIFATTFLIAIQADGARLAYLEFVGEPTRLSVK